MEPKLIPAFIRRRCPGATETELRDAYERFQTYLQLAYRIYERGGKPEDSHESRSTDKIDNMAERSLIPPNP